ncbi:MAG: hypothetical protein SFW36_00225 [Leptolyngbyaceae cyanobacterium bins.59]|nr:hypothetical protein [Leptolyngbyaceae cyanobacterium bins.59]
MIHHVSFAAINPFHVATVMAEVMQGTVAPFPPNPGSYIVIAGDEHGTMLEIYPLNSQILPGLSNEEAVFAETPNPSRFTATHIALSINNNEETICQIAAREGWRVLHAERDGFFEVIEFWVENRLMVELLPPSIAPRYLAFMQPQNLAKLFAEMEPEMAMV